MARSLQTVQKGYAASAHVPAKNPCNDAGQNWHATYIEPRLSQAAHSSSETARIHLQNATEGLNAVRVPAEVQQMKP